MSLPLRSESSLIRSAPDLRRAHGALAVILVALALRLLRRARVVRLAASFTSRSPSWSFRALRRSNICSDASRISTFASSNIVRAACCAAGARTCVRGGRLLRRPSDDWPSGFPPRLRCVLGVSHSLDAFFRSCLPALFRAGAVHGLSSLRRFLPARSPASLSALGVLRAVTALARDRLRGFQHRSDACRRFVGLALTALAPSLVVVPLRGLYLPVSLRASASLLSWASLGHPPTLRPSGISTCSSECQRT